MSLFVSSGPGGAQSVYIPMGSSPLGGSSVRNGEVAQPSPAYRSMSNDWAMVSVLWAGTSALRVPGVAKQFLPQYPKETDDDYRARLTQSVLTNFYRTTIKRAVGKIFKQPIVLNDDVPPGVRDLEDNIDERGGDISSFGLEVAEAAMNYGMTHILVDYQQVSAEELAAMDTPNGGLLRELSMNLRPYWVHVKPTQLIGWKSRIVGGKFELTQIRIYEEVEVDDPNNEFGQTCVKRVRVYDVPGRIRVFELQTNATTKQEEWVLRSDDAMYWPGGKQLDRIPLVTIYTNKRAEMQAEPMLADMAHLNVAHFQSDSDQRNILHVVRVPILFYKATSSDDEDDFELNVGPFVVTRGGPESDLKYVEHQGGSIEAGNKDLADLEARMGEMAMALVMRQQPGNPTATGAAIDSAETDSPLHSVALALQDGIDRALDLTSLWLNGEEDTGGTCRVNTDFGLSQASAEHIKTLTDARRNGDISRETYWNELMRHGYLVDTFDPQVEADRLELEASGLGGLGSPDMSNAPGDETEPADGHTHTLEANGQTNTVDGHFHTWTPQGDMTGIGGAPGEPPHQHGLAKGIQLAKEVNADGTNARQGAPGQTPTPNRPPILNSGG